MALNEVRRGDVVEITNSHATTTLTAGYLTATGKRTFTPLCTTNAIVEYNLYGVLLDTIKPGKKGSVSRVGEWKVPGLIPGGVHSPCAWQKAHLDLTNLRVNTNTLDPCIGVFTRANANATSTYKPGGVYDSTATYRAPFYVLLIPGLGKPGLG